MMSRKLSVLFALFTSVAGVACAGSTDDASSGAADLTARKATVTGAKADRLLAALGNFGDVVDSAMGGRSGADVTGLSCVTTSNAMLDETDPMYKVAQTTCSFDATGFTPAHRDVTDDATKAQVLFDAIAAASASLVDTGMGSSHIVLKTASCAAQGPGAGDDPANPPPTTATCTLTSDDGRTAKVSGDKALRITQAFGLAGATDQAMGGHFGTDATALSCDRQSNEALDETSPSFEVPAYQCSFKVDGIDDGFKLNDAEAKAHELSLALVGAGLVPDSAMGGKSGVGASHVVCTKGPGAATRCTLTP